MHCWLFRHSNLAVKHGTKVILTKEGTPALRAPHPEAAKILREEGKFKEAKGTLDPRFEPLEVRGLPHNTNIDTLTKQNLMKVQHVLRGPIAADRPKIHNGELTVQIIALKGTTALHYLGYRYATGPHRSDAPYPEVRPLLNIKTNHTTSTRGSILVK